jgi:hypothetical protein
MAERGDMTVLHEPFCKLRDIGALSERQRRVFVALVVEGIPLDALAAELGSTRNAIYKTMFDARQKIRAHLTAHGHLRRDRDPDVGEIVAGPLERPQRRVAVRAPRPAVERLRIRRRPRPEGEGRPAGRGQRQGGKWVSGAQQRITALLWSAHGDDPGRAPGIVLFATLWRVVLRKAKKHLPARPETADHARFSWAARSSPR